MESELSPDNNKKKIPPVPSKTYQWEDLKKARKAGGYPWTHILKAPLEGEITAEDIIRETTPRRSMSREFSKSRTHSPVDTGVQKILKLDSSPGSSRKHSEEGKEDGVHIPNFSKEISLDSEDDIINKVSSTAKEKRSDNQSNIHLSTPKEKPTSVSPKSILKRRLPEPQYIGITETREKTKCCHPLVNKIKHLADKTLQKLDRVENEKSPGTKRKKNEELQEIRQLKNSPGAIRRQKFSAIKLGSSDEMTKTMSIDTPPPRKKKEHIYEDIEESKESDTEKSLHFSPDGGNCSSKVEILNSNLNENDSITEKKSNTSQDPSLVVEDNTSLKEDEYIMEKLHKIDDINKEAVILDDEMDSEPNVEEVYQNQKYDTRKNSDSPNITITEIYDDDNTIEQSTAIPIESSPSPSPRNNNQKVDESINKDWSTPNSDHEYEIIDKPPPNIIYTAPSIDEKPTMVKTDDELSSTTSLERKYLHHTSDEDEQIDDKENVNSEKMEEFNNAETIQKDIEERFFVNTPSTVSRTECEVSTSQVDSSALENLPLKRSSRNKSGEGGDNKIQQRIKEGTGKLKTQAGKLKTKLHNLRNKQFSLPDRPKINMPERPKFKMPDRPKFTLPEKRKFSLPERPKFKKINISEKLSFGDRKKFTFPDRPKFNVPEMPKFRMPERPKINFPSLGRKKEHKMENNMSNSTSDLQNVATVDFEAKTYPRLFHRKKKSQLQKTSSSPTLNREDTPPPTFTFTRVKKVTQNEPVSYTMEDSSEQPREYGTVDNETNYDTDVEGRKQFSRTYDFDKLDQMYMDEEENQQKLNENRNANSITDMSPSKLEYTHINEINNDEFFVRPRGISRENIQVREYLSDEIRQAFNIPKNVLAVMGNNEEMNSQNVNEPEEESELMNDCKEPITYSTEDLNDRDDGYYTFPPVRPSRAKRKKRESESIQFIDDSVTASMQFSEIDLGISEDQVNEKPFNGIISSGNADLNDSINDLELRPPNDLHSIHEYANDDVIEYPESMPIQSQTLPMPPKRKRKSMKNDLKHSSLNDFTPPEIWHAPKEQTEDIIVYRTEHEYIVPQSEIKVSGQSPLPPRRNRSRSSRATSLCDDDRTSHGAESLILDTHILATDDVEVENDLRQESPGYATVDKGNYTPAKAVRRSKSKTPPHRQRKSNSAERKYYTVSGKKTELPSRPPRKKSSTSLMTLNSFTKDSMNGDLTQYDEIDEPRSEEIHKDLQSGAVVSKMKDRPLPPPPRPPRGPKRKQMSYYIEEQLQKPERRTTSENLQQSSETQDVAEIEVSTQTDPLPDDIDFELGMDDNLDISMSSSLRDIVDEESILGKAHDKAVDSRRTSRPVSRSEKSFKLSDPKIHSELPKPNLERTSPTVILVEKRVSSPTRINEREEILTEASLTVQHIDIEESLIPDVPPLPNGKNIQTRSSKKVTEPESEHALERVSDSSRDIQLDNLITQRLQVRDLDVGRLNVSELQATKILVSDIEGMTLNVNEMDSKSGHISISGIEFSQSVIDEIVKKFAEISTNAIHPVTSQTQDTVDTVTPVSREEETQTDMQNAVPSKTEETASIPEEPKLTTGQHLNPPYPETTEEISVTPQRPPPPDLTPLLYSYLQDIAIPTSSLHPRTYSHRERHLNEFHDQHQPPPAPIRRSKRKPAVLHSESSSDEDKPRPSPRRLPPPSRIHEPTVTEAGAQFLRVCQTSISRTFRNIFNMFMTYINRTEDKRDVQMAMVIFLVLIAGLIMFGLSDSRTIHHHHWEFFNPPDGKQ